MHTASPTRSNRALGIATWAILALGFVLRVIAYTRRSMLWTDEAATAQNIVERPLGALLAMPLDYGQAAPKGFLLVEWIVTRTLGPSPIALRWLPFVTSLVALALFTVIARRVLPPLGALAAMLFLAVGYWFLVYASDVHPYGLDLALSLAALLLIIDLRRTGYPRRRVWWTAAFGAIAAWCSNGVLLAMFGLACALGGVAWRDLGLRAAARRLWPIAVVWGVSVAAAAIVATRSLSPDTQLYFDRIHRDGMVPVLRSPAAFAWLFAAWRSQLAFYHGWWVDNPAWTSLYPALALVGFASLAIRRTANAMFVGSVVAAFVVVSMVKRYPFEARFLLPSIAVFVLGVGESIGVLTSAAWGRARVLGAGLAVALCLPPVARVLIAPPPYQWTVAGSYLAQIRARWQPGDVVYSAYTNAFEVAYAAPQFGLRAEDYILGPCDFADVRTTLRAVDVLRGRRRVWVIVGSGNYFPLSPEYAYLRAIGVRRDSLPVDLPGSIRFGRPEPFDISTAYLFDLSDSTRLGRWTSETFELSPLMRPYFRSTDPTRCFGVWGGTGSGRRRTGGGGRATAGADADRGGATGDGRRATVREASSEARSKQQ